MIKSVIFDLGGVYFTDGTRIAIDKISKKYKLSTDDVIKFLKTGSTLGTALRKGKISNENFWNEFKGQFNLEANNDDLTKIWIRSYKPIYGTVEIVKKLKKHGLSLYFLSDNVEKRSEYLQKKYKFIDKFIDGIFSFKVGKTKSDGEIIFKISLKMTKDKPREIIYIDDKERYVETAKKLGMNAIHFKNPKQLNQELKKFIK